jgi:hypothetical protein
VRDERLGTRPGADPEGDAVTVQLQWRHGSAPQFRLVTGSHERAAGHPHRRHACDGTQVHSKPGTPRMVKPARVD